MAFFVSASAPHRRTAPFRPLRLATAAAVLKRILRFPYDAVMLSRERQAQRDIERIVGARDGCFTDSLEREIAERSYSRGRGFGR